MDIFFKAADSIGEFFLSAPVLLGVSFGIVNIFTMILYYADKQKAKKHRWRIPEATLIFFAFIGGSFGAFAAMRIFRHKTKHPKFYISVPVFMLIHAAIVVTGFVGIYR